MVIVFICKLWYNKNMSERMNSVPSVQKPIDIDDTFAQIAILYTNDEARRLIEEAYAGLDTSSHQNRKQAG